MSSPFTISPFTYGDLPWGGELAPIIITNSTPTSSNSAPHGYFWLSALDAGGNGNLYYQAGNTSNAPNWVLISSSSGAIQSVTGTANQVSVTADANPVISLPTALTAPGSVTVTNKLNFTTGSNKSVGTSGAMTAGAVTVANTSVTATSLIFCYPAALGTVTAPQAYRISAQVAATSFTITSADATDTSTWNYMIVN